MYIFNRKLHYMRRQRAAANFHKADFIVREAASRLADRLQDIKREFDIALELGCHTGQLTEYLQHSDNIVHLVQADFAPNMVAVTDGELRVALDEENLPFANNSFAAIFSVLSLHWVNDLPGCLLQCSNILRPDGLLLLMLPGVRSLQQLRKSILYAAMNNGGVSPRISPFIDIKDAGALLQRAGFALPVADSDLLTIYYNNFSDILNDLRHMGETNVLLEQHKGLTLHKFWRDVEQYYVQHYATDEGKLPLTIEFIYMTGWKPDSSQQRPLKPGSATARLQDVLSVKRLS